MGTTSLRTLLAAAALALLILPRAARADEPTERHGTPTGPLAAPAEPAAPPPYVPAPPPPHGYDAGVVSERVWYGQPMIALDLAAAILIYGAVEIDDQGENLGVIGGATFVLGAPVVHLMNGQVARGLASFGLRTSLPVTAALLGFIALSREDCRGDVCQPDGEGLYVGGLIGMATGALLDDLLLAHKEVPSAPRWAPGLARVPGGGLTLGITGRF